MKFAFAILAVLAVAGPLNAFKLPNLGNGELAKDIQDFLDLVPVDDVVAVVLKYVADDEEFQEAAAYLQSEEFQQLAKDVEALPEIKDLMNYIQKAGVNIYTLVNMFNEFIGIDKLVVPAHVQTYSGTGVRGFIDEVMALLPVEKLQALYEKKLKESKVFAEFVAQLSSPEFQTIVNKVYVNPHFQDLLEKAKAAGVDVVKIKELLDAILGIKVPSKQ